MARVHIRITVASKQAPLLMHMEYRIRLPDHDFVVGHKLIPCVYLGMIKFPLGLPLLEIQSYK
jgi:hypothetical protein